MKKTFCIFLTFFWLLFTSFAQNYIENQLFTLSILEQVKISASLSAKLPSPNYTILTLAKNSGLFKNCTAWVLDVEKNQLSLLYKENLNTYTLDKESKLSLLESKTLSLKDGVDLQSKLSKNVLNADFCDKNPPKPILIASALDDFNLPRFSALYEISDTKKSNLKDFLAKELAIREKVDFAQMFEEIKTYGSGGFCSQLSQYLWDNNKCPELYKFKTVQIHSCDGFFMIVKNYAIFCPTKRDIKFILQNPENAKSFLFLTHDFAIAPKDIFLNYHINHPLGLIENK